MLNILVIEDDNIRRSLLRLNIEKLGYDVSEAATGREGLEIITEKMPQLIILDITLPDISGLKVLEMIKENVDTLHIPVIIASGRDTDEDIVEGLDCGASDYVTKPYRWNLVNARVKAALREIEIKRLLLEAAFEAKKSNQCKNQFLANMSHEIRTPLNGILGTLQLLEHTSLSTEQQEYSRIISSSGNMLMHLLNDLLDLSKIEANEIELEATVFDIEDLVAEVAEIIYHRACDKKLKVLFSFEDEFPFKLVGDAGRIKQIILNFANNAVKFTDHGHICFGASIVNYSGQNIVCRLTVNDTGLGINDEDKKQMFRKFVQVDSSDTRKYGGSGLGLSICRNLAQIMGGHVAFKSQPGRGSIFWLELPLYVDSTETDRLREEELPQASVLVLEPHKESREIIGMYLGRWGCKFTMVDFVDKDSVLDEMDIDLIISDYSVDNSTLNLSPSVKNSLSGVPHLLLWDQFDKVQNIEELKSCGISAVLAKPFKPRILKEMMRSLLRSVEEGKLLLDTSFETQTLHISELLNKQPLSGYNFLVVEDNIVNQRIVSKILLNLGAEVGQAANGVEALQMISDFSYDVILMDCQMPYMNGFDATRKIREMTQLDKNEVPVIAMTADVMVVNRKRCIEAGMDDYMTKPFNRVTFLKLVYKYLDR